MTAPVLRMAGIARGAQPRPGSEFRQPEIRELRVAVARDQDVLRLDVAMHDLRFVGGGETVGDTDEHLDDLTPGVALMGPLPQRTAIDELGDQVLAILIVARVVYGDDVGMIQ